MKERLWSNFRSQAQASAVRMSCLLFILAMAGGALSACQNQGQSVQGEDEGSFAKLYALFGTSEDQAFSSLSIQSGTDAVEQVLSPDSSDYLLQQPVDIHGRSAELQIGFYNDILMAAEYRFENLEDAYATGKAIRDELAALLGDPVTLDGHPNRLDDLTTLPEEQPLPATYLEEWDITVEPHTLNAIFGQQSDQTQSLHLLLRLSLNDKAHAAVSIRYSMNPEGKETLGSTSVSSK